MLFIAINVIFWAIGGTMLGIGIWLAVDPNALAGYDVPGMNDALYATAVYMTIGIGAGVFLVGFLGCFGGMRADSSRNISLKLYFVLVKIIILAEITTIILMAIFWGSINDNVKATMFEDVHTKYISETAPDSYSKSWNKMQLEWKCCGSNNHRDYIDSNYTRTTENIVPWTCCVMSIPGGDKENDVADIDDCRREAGLILPPPVYRNLYSKGCYYALRDWIDRNAGIIIGVTCGFIGLQIVGLVMACCMMKG